MALVFAIMHYYDVFTSFFFFFFFFFFFTADKIGRQRSILTRSVRFEMFIRAIIFTRWDRGRPFYTQHDFRRPVPLNVVTRVQFILRLCARKSPYTLHPLSSVPDGICALGNAHMRNTPSRRCFPNVHFETVPVFVWLMMALAHPFKEDRLVPPLSTLLSSVRSMV